ncbi:MAG: Smr/MutS family protein [Syntrophomonadaceae bacterium]|nr:Smr/MutS family protein [Syntrophomonadaceae bacterium]
MKVERMDLHGCNRIEAAEKTEKNIAWLLAHAVDVLIIDHGRGRHSEGIAVLKTELRARLRDDARLKQAGYRVVYGESEHPVALGLNDGHTLIVRRGLEQEHIGGRRKQEKDAVIHSHEGKQMRKAAKRQNAQRRQ